MRSIAGLRALSAACVCAVLVVPLLGTGEGAEAAGAKTIHLIGVVEGPTRNVPGPESGEGCEHPTKLKLLDGKESVGVIHLRTCVLAAANILKYRGSVELTVGSLRGKLRVGIGFRSEAQGQLPWGEGPVWKFAPGGSPTRSHRRVSEQIRVKNSGEEPPIPIEDGARLEVLLKPSGKFPPQSAG